MSKTDVSVASLSGQSTAGIYDILESFRRVTLWSTLGWYDFIVRYRRTVVGPLWQTLMVAVWVFGLGFVFGRILTKTGANYTAYLAAGLVLWNYLSSSLSGSTQVFVRNAKLIFSVNNPLYTYALRQIVENLVRFAFQSLVFLAVLPINWVGASLLVLSLVLFGLETQIPSHGILGTGGAVAMLLGAVLLIDGPPELRIRWSTAVAVTLPFALITMFLLTLVVKARNNKTIKGDSGLMNEIGVARTALEPAGKVFIHGEYWDAESSTPVSAGSQVRVVSVEGMKLKVAPKDG